MATATKICRVCGKEYEACHTLKRVAGVFRWQDVACSPECGSVYLAKIEASRAGSAPAREAEDIGNITSDAYGVVDYDENEDTPEESDLADYMDE